VAVSSMRRSSEPPRPFARGGALEERAAYLRLSLYFSCHGPPTSEFYTLSLHDALPISHARLVCEPLRAVIHANPLRRGGWRELQDRKSTRLNSSHVKISYAVFCLKKKRTAISFLGCPLHHASHLTIDTLETPHHCTRVT